MGASAVAEKTEGKRERRSLLHIEVIRILAIFLVMFNHTRERGFLLFAVTDDPAARLFYLCISILDKIAVPLFFMASGAVLLGKEESLWELFRKRILKYGLILLGTSFVYYVWSASAEETGISVKDFISQVYSQTCGWQLWFLYRYLGLLLMLPLLRKLVKVLSGCDYLYLTGMTLLFQCLLPIAEFLVPMSPLNELAVGALFSSTSMIYFLLGHYMEKVMEPEKLTKKLLGLLFAASIVSLGVTCALVLLDGARTGELTESFHSHLIVLPAVTVYLGIKRRFACWSPSEKLRRGILAVSGTTFGIYLMEGFLRDWTESVYAALEAPLGTLFACVVWITAAFALGVLLVMPMKKLPVLRNVF